MIARFQPAKPEGRPEDFVKPKYDWPDAAEWETLSESDKVAHEDAYSRAKDRAVETYREGKVHAERLRKSLEKENQFLPLMD